jgi:hypothetical protein
VGCGGDVCVRDVFVRAWGGGKVCVWGGGLSAERSVSQGLRMGAESRVCTRYFVFCVFVCFYI